MRLPTIVSGSAVLFIGKVTERTLVFVNMQNVATNQVKIIAEGDYRIERMIVSVSSGTAAGATNISTVTLKDANTGVYAQLHQFYGETVVANTRDKCIEDVKLNLLCPQSTHIEVTSVQAVGAATMGSYTFIIDEDPHIADEVPRPVIEPVTKNFDSCGLFDFFGGKCWK
jgi:hypothetical protein